MTCVTVTILPAYRSRNVVMPDHRVRLYLAAWRERRGLSQRELSRASGVRQATISALEAGKASAIRFAALGALADALACQPWELLRGPPR